MLRFVLALLLIASAGCFASAPESQPECSDSNPCPTGQVCLNFVCMQVCDSVAVCAAHEACIGQVCTPYAQSCAGGETCAQGWYCDGAACRRDQTLGKACGDPSECERGFCVDGVCCNAACDGECMACKQELTGDESGRCAPIPAGEDPETECGTHRGCDGVGACLPVDALGASCVEDETCAQQHCSPDGVCCDSACDGICESCLAIYTGITNGTCAPVPEGDDPASECTSSVCSGIASCKGGIGNACVDAVECISAYCSNQLCSVPPSILAPELAYPWNGFATGSHLVDANRQPTFRWEPTAGGVGELTYTLSITETCDPSEPFDTCDFSSPEVEIQTLQTTHTLAVPLPAGIVAPTGTRYYWRVMACDGYGTCSPWSRTRYLDVGVDRKDLNGDGYSDLVVGSIANGVDSVIGRVYVFYGSSGGLQIGSPDVLVSPETEPDATVHFGHDVAVVGDVDRDGYNDLAILAGGRGYLAKGSNLGPSDSYEEFLVPGGTMLSAEVLAAGDMDGDGYADIAAAEDNSYVGSNGIGAVYVFYGRAGAISNTFDHRFYHPEPVLAAPHPVIGSAIAGNADLDGDGLCDLAATVSYGDFTDISTLWTDVVFILGRSGQSRPLMVPATAYAAGTLIFDLDLGVYPTTGYVAALLGTALIEFDGNGDVVGTSYEVRAVEYDGATSVVVADAFEAESGDIDGDGEPDVVTYLGDVEGAVIKSSRSGGDVAISPPPGGDSFGSRDWAVIGDSNADGFDDLAFTDGDEVHVYLGGGAGIVGPTTIDDPDADPLFARSLD